MAPGVWCSGGKTEVVLVTCAGRPDRLWSALTYALGDTLDNWSPWREEQPVKLQASGHSLLLDLSLYLSRWL